MRIRLVAVLAMAAGAWLSAQGAQPPITPFKLGTLQLGNRSFLGIVVGTTVIDLAAANTALATGRIASPADMKQLITRYDTGVRARIVEIIRHVNGLAVRPAYVHALADVKTLPPIMYPTTMLNAAVNYRAHGEEMSRGASPQVQAPATAPPPGTAAAGTKSIGGIWERAPGDTRWNPYMFLKSPTAVIAHGEAIVVPPGRKQVDWECELGVVIAKPATAVPIAQAASYIFGYTMEMDVSDREARGDERYGSDWLIAKSHATFAPLGPFITPREFVQNPRNLRVTFSLNGQVMQDANTSLMIHDVFELVAYGSSILTLRPGDVLATGTPAGVGSARSPAVFLKAGDKTSCTYEGVGTLNNEVR
jgi:2-keto-4-pentenoate hydratase/2-oxohepta-3-ene-1,7-dioic acid hydratase in catechol pathway